MAKAAKYFRKISYYGARAGWAVFNKLNSIAPTPLHPKVEATSPSSRATRKKSRPSAGPAPPTPFAPKCIPEILSADRRRQAAPTRSCQ